MLETGPPVSESPSSLLAVLWHHLPTSSGDGSPPFSTFPWDRKGQWLSGVSVWNPSSDCVTPCYIQQCMVLGDTVQDGSEVTEGRVRCSW